MKAEMLQPVKSAGTGLDYRTAQVTGLIGAVLTAQVLKQMIFAVNGERNMTEKINMPAVIILILLLVVIGKMMMYLATHGNESSRDREEENDGNEKS